MNRHALLGAALVGGIAIAAFLAMPMLTHKTKAVATLTEIDMTKSCGGNTKLMQERFKEVFQVSLTAQAFVETWSVKSAFNSDLFALAALPDDLSFGDRSFAAPDDWQQARIKSAREFFEEELAGKTAEPAVISGFTPNGVSKIVVVDFGADGLFAYFEL